MQHIDRANVESIYKEAYMAGSRSLFFARCHDQNETWVPLIEKAYAKAHGDYLSLEGGWSGEGLEDLSGGVTTGIMTSDILDTNRFWDEKMSKASQDYVFGASAGILEDGYGDREGISENHAYAVIRARRLSDGQRLVKLRNPWGVTHEETWQGAWSDGSSQWTKEVLHELNHKFGDRSCFWISFEDFLRKYSYIEQTRLFHDPEWRCCQRWIAVDVPWRAEYHRRFCITLAERSSLVLVLSQLDGRYFEGLRGQYSFRLYFRLCYEGDRNDEKYVARSHDSYLMTRSVSAEISDASAGSYVVYVKVVGERDTSLPSIEKVVRGACAERTENDKLAWAGREYDFAHRKPLSDGVKLGIRSDEHLRVSTNSRQNSPERRLALRGSGAIHASHVSTTHPAGVATKWHPREGCVQRASPLRETQSGTWADEDLEKERESRPDAWNAVCIAGLRVYSKDKDLIIQRMQ